MKAREYLWRGYILVSILIIGLISCQKEEDLRPDSMATYIPPGSEAAIYSASLSISTSDNNEIIITLDLEDAVQIKDGVCEKIFVLQRTQDEHEKLFKMMEDAKAISYGRSLLIIPRGGIGKLCFTIGEIPEDGRDATIFRGYGLSENNGRWNSDMSFMAGHHSVFDALCSGNFQLKELGGGGSTGTDCMAGGPNATSCSLSGGGSAFGLGVNCSCSVSCGSGNFACCCSCLKCTCISNGTPSPHCVSSSSGS